MASRSVRCAILMLFLFRMILFNFLQSECYCMRELPMRFGRCLLFSMERSMTLLHHIIRNNVLLTSFAMFWTTFILKPSYILIFLTSYSSSSCWMQLMTLPLRTQLTPSWLKLVVKSVLFSCLRIGIAVLKLQPSSSILFRRACSQCPLRSFLLQMHTHTKQVLILRMKPIKTPRSAQRTLCKFYTILSKYPHSLSTYWLPLFYTQLPLMTRSQSQQNQAYLSTPRQAISFVFEPIQSCGKQRKIREHKGSSNLILNLKVSSSEEIGKGKPSSSFISSTTAIIVRWLVRKKRQKGFIFLRDFKKPSTNRLCMVIYICFQWLPSSSMIEWIFVKPHSSDGSQTSLRRICWKLDLRNGRFLMKPDATISALALLPQRLLLLFPSLSSLLQVELRFEQLLERLPRLLLRCTDCLRYSLLMDCTLSSIDEGSIYLPVLKPINFDEEVFRMLKLF